MSYDKAGQMRSAKKASYTLLKLFGFELVQVKGRFLFYFIFHSSIFKKFFYNYCEESNKLRCVGTLEH